MRGWQFWIDRGFGDALRIGYQNRPQIFARNIIRPELLYEHRAHARTDRARLPRHRGRKYGQCDPAHLGAAWQGADSNAFYSIVLIR